MAALKEKNIFRISLDQDVNLPIKLGPKVLTSQDFTGVYSFDGLQYSEKPLWAKKGTNFCIYLMAGKGWCVGVSVSLGKFLPVFQSTKDKDGLLLLPPVTDWRLTTGQQVGIKVEHEVQTTVHVPKGSWTPGQPITFRPPMQRMIQNVKITRVSKDVTEVERAAERFEIDAGLMEGEESKCLEVTNVFHSVTHAEFSSAFEAFGEIERLYFSKAGGEGRVIFKSIADARECLKAPPSLGGQVTTVHMASEGGQSAMDQFDSLIRNGCTDFIHPRVYDAVVKLAFRYARSGIEKTILGHILIVGDLEEILRTEVGQVTGMNDFEFRDINVLTGEGRNAVFVRMNHDLATVIDGKTGKVACNWFQIHLAPPAMQSHTGAPGLSQRSNPSGGSGVQSSISVTRRCPSAVVFKISTDSKGEIKHFKNDRMTILYNEPDQQTTTKCRSISEAEGKEQGSHAEVAVREGAAEKREYLGR